MIAAFSKGYQVFGNQVYADAARGAVGFILKNLRTADSRLLRRYREGEAAYPAYLDDYAFLVWGLIELYEATFDVSYLEEAIALNEGMIDIFWDKQGGGLYFTGKGNEPLITRSKELYDGALPSGNSVAALNLLRLGRMTGNVALEQKAEELTQIFSRQITDQPMAYTQVLVALDFMVGPPGDCHCRRPCAGEHAGYDQHYPEELFAQQGVAAAASRVGGQKTCFLISLCRSHGLD